MKEKPNSMNDSKVPSYCQPRGWPGVGLRDVAKVETWYSGGQKYRTALLVISQPSITHAILQLKASCSTQITVNKVLNHILDEIKCECR